MIVVSDESANDNTNGGGQVVAVLISSKFSHVGYQSTTLYQHQSTLRLMLEGLGIHTLPGAAATAPSMGEFFDPPTSTGSPLTISTTILPTGTVGQPYNAQLSATGGTPPYSWSIVSGSLSLGLTLSASGGLSGVATTAVTNMFTVQVTDAQLLTAQQSFSITISAVATCAPTRGGAGP